MSKSNSFKNENIFSEDGDNINLLDLLKILNERKARFLKTSGSIMLLTIIVTIIQRIFFPIYMGTLSILISNPLITDQKASRLDGFIDRGSTDINNLRELLLSPKVLEPIANKHDKNLKYFKKNLQIVSGGFGSREKALGVLKISLKGRNRVKTERILKDLNTQFFEGTNTMIMKRVNRIYINSEKQELANILKDFNPNSILYRNLEDRINNFEDFSKSKIIEAAQSIESLNIYWEEIAEPKVDKDPIRPKESINLLVGIFLSLTGGLITVFSETKSRSSNN